MNIDVKRKKEKRNKTIRWILYYLMLVIEYIFMTTVQVNIPLPLFLLSTAMCISVVEDPFDSALTGCAAGLMLDAAEGTLMGMNGILMMWCCLMSSLLFYFVMRRHFFNVLLVNTAAVFIQTGFRYLFYYLIWGYERSGVIYLHEFLPIILTTVASAALIYPLVRFMNRRLGLIRESFIEEKSDDIVRE
ncbi:MAG: rod shape-determining protein MreD [Oscillospiraceae bacterium]